MGCLRLLASLHLLVPSIVESSVGGPPSLLGVSRQAASGAHLWYLPVESKTCSHRFHVRRVRVVLRACRRVVVVHLVQVQAHLVVGKVLCWESCRKSSQVEDGTGVHAVAVDHCGRHGAADVEDNRASVVVLHAAGKEVENCSLDGCCVVVDRDRNHIPGHIPGGDHGHRDRRVDTFPILYPSWYLLCVGLFLFPC